MPQVRYACLCVYTPAYVYIYVRVSCMCFSLCVPKQIRVCFLMGCAYEKHCQFHKRHQPAKNGLIRSSGSGDIGHFPRMDGRTHAPTDGRMDRQTHPISIVPKSAFTHSALPWHSGPVASRACGILTRIGGNNNNNNNEL